jgi:hypothetical protein
MSDRPDPMLAFHVSAHSPGERPQLVAAFLLKTDALRFIHLIRRELPHRDVKFRYRYVGRQPEGDR